MRRSRTRRKGKHNKKVTPILLDTYRILASYAGAKSKAKLAMPQTIVNGCGFPEPTYVHNKVSGRL
jgi:hypothetical protein